MKRLLLITAALTLGLAGITASTAAMAATTHQARLATSAATARPTGHDAGRTRAAIDNCTIVPNSFTEYASNCGRAHGYTCGEGHARNFAYVPTFVSNGCSDTVDIFTGPNETGSSLGIGSNTSTGSLGTSYHSFRVT